MRHGNALGQDDRLAIVIDPFNTGRNGYRFETNANGVRHDMLYQNITELQSDWTVIWDTSSSADDKAGRSRWRCRSNRCRSTRKSTPGASTSRAASAARARKSSGCRATAATTRASSGTRPASRGMDQGVGLDVVPSLSVNHAQGLRRPPRLRHRKRPVARRVLSDHSVVERLAHVQHGLFRDRGRRSPSQSHALQLVLSREARFLPERLGSVRVRPHRHSREPGRRHAEQRERPTVLLAAHRLERYGRARRSASTAARSAAASAAGASASLAVRQDDFGPVEESSVFVARVQADVLAESNVGLIVTQGDPDVEPRQLRERRRLPVPEHALTERSRGRWADLVPAVEHGRARRRRCRVRARGQHAERGGFSRRSMASRRSRATSIPPSAS